MVKPLLLLAFMANAFFLVSSTAKCTMPHEVYDPCPVSCPPQICESLWTKYDCTHKGKVKEIIEECEGKCVCEEGYYRNKIGECTAKEDCLKCKGPHEYFSCGPACDNICGLLDKQNQTHCPIINIVCNKRCYCEEGYARDENHICIPIKDCKVCGPNEEFEICPANRCQPENCTQVGFPFACTAMSYDDWNCPTKSACLCKDGYVRDDRGVCVSMKECPSCGGDPKAVSGCGVYCNQRCRDIGKKPRPCPLICNVNTCDCREGHYLDENTGLCVLPKHCTPQCPANEIYSDCIQGNCSPQNCSQVGFPVPCPDILPKYCKKGCLCKEGYVRNEKGKCIPSTECPSCGGDPKAIAGCGIYCNQRCRDVGKKPGPCIAMCIYNSCDCREGYFLDENTGLCVLAKNCTPQCPANEYYSDCIQGNCSPQNCSQLGFPVPCPKIDPKYCKKGCLCKEGYVRNEKGICIPSTECPSCGGDPKAIAGCGIYCNQRCRDVGKEPGACIAMCIYNSCDCREGYFLDENTGLCVLPKHCTPQCPANEFYSDCSQGNCSPQNCSQLGFPVPCPKIDPKYCKKGCLCKEGYVRNEKGICIPSTECPSCGGDPKAIAGCGIYCNQRCRDVGKEPGACIAMCIYNSCDCRDGYFLDENTGLCVLPKRCTPQCPANEFFSDCIQGNCSPQNCSQLGFPVPCPKIDPKYCKKGCLCKEGYVRNEKGICIPSTECPSCGGDPKAIAGCGIYCNQRCRDVGKKPGACILLCKYNSCDCREGYFLDENTGICVLPKNCSPQCPTNEWYSECIQGNCSPQNCSQLGFPIPCPRIDPKYCKKGCLCKDGFVRNKKGICVPLKECPSCGGDPNAQSGCGTNCNKHCSDVGKEPGVCALGCILNGCDCKDGYFFDNNIKKCVKPQECTPICLDKNNEVYSDCINGGCQAKNCSQYGQPVPCAKIDPKYCITGCICKEGYLRAASGKCIPEKNCPEACNGPNEEYNECSWDCPPQTCESLDRVYICPIIDGNDCRPMCRCKPGYFRNKIGQCITEKECRRCMGPHEYFSCGGACDNVCETLDEQSQDNCPIINIKCNEMCYCERGYARAKNNTCIPISSCEEPQCPINERYEQCPGSSCEPQHCSQLGFPLPCPASAADGWCPNKPGCVCVDGYVRNKKGICIPKKDCPSCGGDRNAKAGCGVNCGQRCRDLGNNDIACIEICYPNACDCKDGYYYDANQKKCVLPGECTDICDKNEVFENCSNPVCRAQNCSLLGLPLDCKSDCRKGCICREGYARDQNGNCIPVKECPSCGGDSNAESGCGVNCLKRCWDLLNPDRPRPCPKICHINACDCRKGYYLDDTTNKCVLPEDCNACNGPNEEYNECSWDCPPQTCESLDRAYVCPLTDGNDCRPMCRCKLGYFRNKIGQCITEKECRRCMGPHEYFSCGGACDNVCENLDEQSQDNCPIINIKCNEMCYCEKDYARAKNNTCIPISHCNEPQCPINEKYERCPGASCEPQYCSQLGFPIPCPAKAKHPDGWCPTKPACVCIDGYVRNDKGICIPKKECPSCGGDCNAQAGCGVNCDKKCSDVGREGGACIDVCYHNACDCKDGFYFDPNQNKCVLPEQCTDLCGENEIFEDCSDPICRARNCTQLGFPLNCESGCQKGCICDEGYARDHKGRCIPVNQCPSCGGDVNAKSGCGVNCLNKCWDLQNPDHPRPCPRICYPNACDCRDGYYLDENINKCVLSKKCTPACGINEMYTPCANGGCEMKNCSQLGGPQLCIDPIKCIGGCICKKGFLRLKNGTCVPYDQCPPPKCKKNERFELCPAKICEPQSCRALGFPIECPAANETCPGYPDCICDNGFVRNNKGICIPKSECPSCGGDPNAQAGCGINCGKRCPDNILNTRLCPRVCFPNACDCKDGYFYDANVEKCVKHADCSPRCEDLSNLEYDPCVNGGCGWRNCSDVGGPILCIDPIKCIKGCRCIKGYYRLNDGTCVPEDECPNNCPIKNKKCVERCYCEDGYARDEEGICIPIHQCPGRGTTCKPTPSTNATEAIAKFELGNQALAGEFIYQLLKSRPGENFMVSGFSVLIALAQLALKAEGVTSQQLMSLLNLDTKDEIETIFPILIKNYRSQLEVTFEIGVKYYSDIDYPFNPDFTEESKDVFDAEVQTLDFAQNEEAADTINEWVANRTKGLITDLVSADMFSEDTVCVLTNCLYFLGNWDEQFNKNLTEPRDFYIDGNKTVLVDTMYREGKYGYGESDELDCKILEIDYKGHNFSFVIFLPNSKTGLPDLVEKLRHPENFANGLALLNEETVRAYVPVIDITSDISDLPELLKSVNITEVFNTDSHDLQGILQNDIPLYISDAIQKTRIKVDETGTEAAAATAIVARTTSAQFPPPETYTFQCDHPFAFFLPLDDFTLFAGIYSGEQ